MFFPTIAVKTSNVTGLSVARCTLIATVFLVLNTIRVFYDDSISSCFLLLYPSGGGRISNVVARGFVTAFSTNVVNTVFSSKVLHLSSILGRDYNNFFTKTSKHFHLCCMVVVPFIVVNIVVVSEVHMLFFRCGGRRNATTCLHIVHVTRARRHRTLRQ